MNQIIENGQIEEMICGNNFAYALSDNSYFSLVEYKILQNQREGCFIKLAKNIYNGKIQFYYLISGYRSLDKLVTNLDSKRFMIVVHNLLKNVREVSENGFLTIKNINISPSRIYVDTNTYKVLLIYLPANIHFSDNETAFESDLRSSISRMIPGIIDAKNPAIQKFAGDLLNGTVSLEQLMKEAQDFAGPAANGMGHQGQGFSAGGQTPEKMGNQQGPFGNQKSMVPPDEQPGRGGRMGMNVSMPKLVSQNPGERIVINITKNEFVIGKKRDMVDGLIADGKVSRTHCLVEKKENGCRIVDLGSTNGTFVNGNRLQPRCPHPLRPGDMVRIANVTFRFEVE